MTVALVLAAEADAGLCGRLAALGVHRVDAAAGSGNGDGLLTIAAAARAAGEPVLICAGDGDMPGEVLVRLLGAPGTAAFTGHDHPAPRDEAAGRGALVVDTPDLDTLAAAAEMLAASHSTPDAVTALLGELARRGVDVRVLDAGPHGEGAFAQLLADPAARDIARWADRRDLSPAALYGISLGLGLLSAVWFTELALRAQALAVATLLGSFVAGRAGSLLAATAPPTPILLVRDGPGTRVRARLAVAWFAVASGIVTELAVYAALAASATIGGSKTAGTSAGLNGVFGGDLQSTFVAGMGGGGQAGVWRLAIAAMIMLGVRRLAGLCYERGVGGTTILFPHAVMRRVEQAVTLPAGERYALIAVTSVFAGPRLTFVLLLCWGAVALGYLLAGYLVGSALKHSALVGAASGGTVVTDAEVHGLEAYRDDGIVSCLVGRVVEGRLPPLLPVIVGLFVSCVLAALGLANLPGVLILTPTEAMLLAALGACHPHDGRLDWMVPALLLTGECVFLAALGFSYHVTWWVIFAMVAAAIMRHFDLAHRARHGLEVSADGLGLGWDGRMLAVSLATMFGITSFAFAVLSGYLWLLFCWDFLSGWLTCRDDGDY